jgi:ribosome-binding factor A
MRYDSSPRDASQVVCAELDHEDRKVIHLPSQKGRGRRSSSRHEASASGHVDRKAWQLCRQVGQTLDEVLADCRDAVLQGLRVDSVEPFPDASRLLVSVAFIDDRPDQIAEVDRAISHLTRASGHLRSEVATAITRKRAPLLVYRFTSPPVW